MQAHGPKASARAPWHRWHGQCPALSSPIQSLRPRNCSAVHVSTASDCVGRGPPCCLLASLHSFLDAVQRSEIPGRVATIISSSFTKQRWAGTSPWSQLRERAVNAQTFRPWPAHFCPGGHPVRVQSVALRSRVRLPPAVLHSGGVGTARAVPRVAPLPAPASAGVWVSPQSGGVRANFSSHSKVSAGHLLLASVEGPMVQ